ncbi:hypothetical protein BASA50_001145 [Batrachochytrium salamandrivorans]|uniref:Transmembrane protein 138 n=1 Tax=Batrachochytrium salamandrivorans TaxID=1357716 RepID=A0ABQ8ERS8_9FUNG|nr:hypothetical protein BASA60_008813 [Batrachochytrium salamandrivorans]KAH6578047.1 hypothetical protein BASA62_000486 [Batrachochytrium salamandrivorans]KAH6585536.1 hypothetical protein BASA50_001145 [Batrachochytrium salamandrivorans]KAH9248381.1 hypothetical protein BASA81_013967 [Batrachochytrium salamandrivorans]KAH9271395.1 hypothetical protein BASA83_006487 [Batrachochytrium salamandrivorans]
MATHTLSILPRSLTTGLIIQHLLLIVDIAFTLFGEAALHTIYIVIISYILQLICIGANILLLYFRFTHTLAFQAGRIRLIVREFYIAFTVTGIYWLITAVYRLMGVLAAFPCNNQSCDFFAQQNTVAIMIITRIAAIGYYHSMHMALLQICDPCYYTASPFTAQALK